ncbi:hypothetical protein N7517_006346 [Penicillium concentricum]|uniref:Allergen Asp f 4 n=1 Tax=Penicillium concentricum TaxID=293559 RepID=A0A9W9SAB8_9EURO|nr:uncharacterized protein N7517_006346 [Penicillium concentricum]KAJ5374340.1 hypothetical protein N7517_006346 [Penicillium concentricum]
MGRVSIPILLAGLAGYAFAGIHHHAHGHLHHHRRRNLMPPTEDLELQNLGWDNANHIPEDIVVESITITTTTTVFGKCAPTDTIHSTLTLVRHSPEPTSWSTDHHLYIIPRPEPYQDHWDQLQPEPILPAPKNTRPAEPHFTQPAPWAPRPIKAEETTTMFKTQTITKTATNTITVTVHPGANHVPLANVLPGNNPSEAERPVPLADTLPKGSLEEEKAVPANRPPPPPSHKSNGGPNKAGLDIHNLPVVNQISPGPKQHRPTTVDWTAIPPAGQFSTNGFGGRTPPKAKGAEVQYRGNVGIPWGSNIITVSPDEAHAYKYVARFTGSSDESWTVVVWNKFGPDGKLTGWYGHSALKFTLAPGEIRHVAFDEDSEGAWGAAPGDRLPRDQWGGYSCTWGEFTFGDGENNGWSGWDVSAIQAQVANQHVQGMSICQADGEKCSIITTDAKKVVAAYTKSVKHIDGIGGEAVPGPVRLDVLIDYRG